MERKNFPPNGDKPQSSYKSSQKQLHGNSLKAGKYLPRERSQDSVIVTNLIWKEDDVIESKYIINSVLHQQNSSYRKYIITNLALCRNFVMIVLQPKQLTVLKELTPIHNKWKLLGNHPNIVQLLYVDHFQKIPLLFTEYLPCASLKDLVLSGEFYTKESSKSLSLKTFRLCFSVAQALQYAHAHGLLHTNLKPSNILELNESTHSFPENHIGGHFCVTDFGSPYLMPSSFKIQENFNQRAFNECALFWPPLFVQFLQNLFESKTIQGNNSTQEEFANEMKKKADLFSFGTNLLFVLTGKISWRDPSELNRNFVIQILESSTINSFDQTIISSLLEIILKCFNLETGYQSFEEILSDLERACYKFLNIKMDLYDPYAEDLNKQRLLFVERLNTTATSDLIKPNNRCFQRSDILSQEIKKIVLHREFTSADPNWERLVIKTEYNKTICDWLSGKGFDYKLKKRLAPYPLYKAFIYDCQRNNSKAIDYYKEALRGIEDDRFKAIMTRQKILSYGIENEQKRRLYGHQKKNDIFFIKVLKEGKKAISIASNDSIIIWDLVQLKQIFNLYEQNINAIDTSSDGNIIILGKKDGNIVFLQKEKETDPYNRKEHKAHKTSVTLISLCRDQSVVASTAFSFEIILWDAHSHSILTTITTQSTIKAFDLNQNAQILLLAEANSTTISLYQYVGGKEYTYKRQAELKGHKSLISHLKLTSDARIAISAGIDGSILLWSLTDLKVIKEILLGDFITNMEITPMGKYSVIKTGNKILIYEMTSNVFIKSINYKGKNSGLGILLEDSSFDYLRKDAEILYLRSYWKGKNHEDFGITNEDYVQDSSMNCSLDNSNEEERLDDVKKIFHERNQCRIESLTKLKKDIELHLIVLTGDLTTKGNSLKVSYIPIPFCGPYLSEVILSHEVHYSSQESRTDLINQIIDEIQISHSEKNIKDLYEQLQRLKLLDNIFDHPAIIPIYNELSQVLTPRKILPRLTLNVNFKTTDDQKAEYFEISLENNPLDPLIYKYEPKIKEYYWKEFIANLGSNFCCESKEDITHIHLIEFSKDDRMVIVVNRALYCWVLETENWNILIFLNIKTLNFNSSLEIDQVGNKIDFLSSAALSNNGRFIFFGIESGDIYIVETSSRSIIYAAQGHFGKITTLVLLEKDLRFITGGSDGNIKFWDANKQIVIFEFKKHYAAIEFITAIQTDNKNSTAFESQHIVASVDSEGFAFVWNLNNGDVLQVFKGHPNGSYWISSINPLKLIISYIKDEKLFTEWISFETKEDKQEITNGYVLENEFISPSFYQTALNSKSKDFKKPYFFFSNSCATTYCIANKNDKEIRISHSGQRGQEVKINVGIDLKILKPNHSFTCFLASDGQCLKVFTIENSYNDFIKGH